MGYVVPTCSKRKTQGLGSSLSNPKLVFLTTHANLQEIPFLPGDEVSLSI